MVDSTELEPWIPKLTAEYLGEYQFGDAIPDIQHLRLLAKNQETYFAQIVIRQYNEFTMDYTLSFLNIDNVTIDKHGQIDFHDFKGQFVLYTGFGQRLKCLKLDRMLINPEREPYLYEIGKRTNSPAKMFPGIYPMASLRELAQDELNKYSLHDLQIMRNEIFARYGYEFKEGGEMHEYFSQKNWYKPSNLDVTEFLTEVELANIKLIRSLENGLNGL